MERNQLNTLLQEFQEEDQELARQILDLRQMPSPDLLQRLQAIPQKQGWSLGQTPRWAWGLAMVLLVALFFVSPSAQATLGGLETMIGRIRLRMLDTYVRPTEPIRLESQPMSLAEARATVPFAFGVPSYLPTSLLSQQQVVVIPLEPPLVTLRWRDQQGGFVQLTAHPHQSIQSSTLIGLNESQTITINDQPAVLVHGAWDEAGHTWRNDSTLVTIVWTVDNIQYRLLAYSDLLTSVELIKLAESVR